MIDHRTSEEELQPLFVEEIFWRASKGEKIAVEVPVAVAMAVLATIQLALRHPGCTGYTANEAAAFGRILELGLARTPAIAEACRRGWNPRYDVVTPDAG